MAESPWNEEEEDSQNEENSQNLLFLEDARNILNQQVVLAQHLQSQAKTALQVSFAVSVATIPLIPILSPSGSNIGTVTISEGLHALGSLWIIFAAAFLFFVTFISLFGFMSDIYLQPWINPGGEINNFNVIDRDSPDTNERIANQYNTWINENKRLLSQKQDEYLRHTFLIILAWSGLIAGFGLLFASLNSIISTLIILDTLILISSPMVIYATYRLQENIRNEPVYIVSILFYLLGALFVLGGVYLFVISQVI